MSLKLIEVKKKALSIEKVVSTNCYDFFVVNKGDLLSKIKTTKRIALYDVESKTRSVLDKLKVNYKFIKDFSSLDEYEILIIGMDSLDDNVTDSGERIRSWIENGGYILCFEQCPSGTRAIPWLEGRKIARCIPYTFVDMVVSKHPVFEGLNQENWDTWNKSSAGNSIFNAVITPLNEELLAAGKSNYNLARAVLQTVIADMKIGNGNCILSQPLAIERYGKDSVATRYIRNLLSYVLKGSNQNWAVEIKEEKKKKRKVIVKVDKKRCYFVNLKPYVNRGFKDEVAFDKKGGWDDAGRNNDMRNLPVGMQEFAGVPFQVINPEENNGNGCIVLRNNSKRYSFLPQKVTGIKTGRKYASNIYFLHVSANTSPKSMLVAKYIIHYHGGAKLTQEVRSLVHINDWWSPQGLPEADVGWTGSNPASSMIGVYVFNLQNPFISQAIESIDFISEETSVTPILIAITLREVGGLEIQ